jgi:hypothetical protein
MARSVGEGFDVFLQRLIPTEAQRLAKERHRASLESCLSSRLTVKRYREIGSFTHGTGVRNHTDADLLVSMGSIQPGSSDTALGWVKTALQSSFPYTAVYIRRPAVVVDFAGGDERWEITLGFLHSRSNGDPYVYDIPAADSGWMTSAPVEHINYVNGINNITGVTGAAKKLARLAKAWKYYNNVPISSFYLEMRAAQHMKTQTGWSAVWDICMLLEKLKGHALADMNDPVGAASRFAPCSSSAKKTEALSKLSTGTTRARNALDAYQQSKPDTAFYYLDLLFGGHFPAR